jgi:hypothetical protein
MSNKIFKGVIIINQFVGRNEGSASVDDENNNDNAIVNITSSNKTFGVFDRPVSFQSKIIKKLLNSN